MLMKRLITGMIIIGLAAGMGFANGSADDDVYGKVPRDGGGRYGFYGRDTETFTGTYDMEDELYPVLETDDGERFYLTIRFPVDTDNLPAVGDDIEIEAFRSPDSPVSLVVLAAEVNGVSLASAWHDDRWDRDGRWDDRWDGRRDGWEGGSRRGNRGGPRFAGGCGGCY